jgi:dihydrodipicolinate synthase/N-acetylneuraminate lyase
MTNFCTTFVYDVLDSITTKEMLELTDTISSLMRKNCIYLSCTAGGSITEVINTTKKMKEHGANGVFIHPPIFVVQGGGGDLYYNYLEKILENTDIPLFSVALPDPWKSTNTPMLNLFHYENLCRFANYMGFKDDYYHIPLRQQIAERFGDRIWIIGGGDFKKYIVNRHHPLQSEFAGMINPAKYKKIFSLLDENRYFEAISLAEEDSRTKPANFLSDLHWIAARAVIFWALGFCESYSIRGPIISATKNQAGGILNKMRVNSHLYDLPVR